MEVKGICHICGKVASRTCRICGRPACDIHIKDGVCASCASGRK